MYQYLFDVSNAIRASLPVFLTVVAFVMALFSFARQQTKEDILSQHKDGGRLVFLAVVALALSWVMRNGAGTMVFTGFAAFLLALGVLIWLPDEWTMRVLHPWVGVVYIALAIYSFLWSMGGYPWSALAIHTFGLTALTGPALLAILFGTLFALSELSSELKARLLPRNRDGAYLVVIAALILLASVFNPNPVYLAGLAGLAAAVATLGVLMWVADGVTGWLLTGNKKWFYAAVTFVIVVVAL